MESIKELRKICQEPRKFCDTWHGKNFARPISIYITVLFLKLRLSANFATGIFLLSGLAASFLLFCPNEFMVLLGALAFQLWYILDHVDGEVARYNKQTSLTGAYFDRISHYIVHPLLFFCLGAGLFFKLKIPAMLILGFFASFSMVLINAVTDIYELTLCQKTQKTINKPAKDIKKISFAKKTFSFFHHLCTFPMIIDIFLIFALVDMLFNKNTVIFFLWFYAICANLIWIFKLSYIVATRKPDKIF